MQRNQIQKNFKLSGLTLEPKALDYLQNLLARIEPAKQSKIIVRIIDSLINLNLENPRITLGQCEEAIKACKTESNYESEVLKTISAFQDNKSHILPEESLQKANLYKNRYDIVYQSLMQSNIFKASTGYSLSSIESLQHVSSSTKEFVVFGMLAKVGASRFILEDPSGSIDLNLENASSHSVLCPEGCFFLVEGTVTDKTLYVSGIGLPSLFLTPYSNISSKLETTANRQISLPDPLCNINTLNQLETLHKVMTTSQVGSDSMLILLGKVTLNGNQTMSRLIQLFNGFAATNPTAFVMYGEFISTKTKSCSNFNTRQIKLLRGYMKNLLSIFCNAFPVAKVRPHLILIPGQNDPILSPNRILPYAPLNPECIPQEYHQDLANPENLFDPEIAQTYEKSKTRKWIHLGTNPLRMRIFNKTAVFFTAEYSRLFFKHSVNNPEENLFNDRSESEVYGDALIQCITSQQHLLPLPMEISVVHWNYDSALSLFPGPDLVCICDPNSIFKFNQEEENENSRILFADLKTFGDIISVSNETNEDDLNRDNKPEGDEEVAKQITFDFNFKVWYPSTSSIEDSRLPDL